MKKVFLYAYDRINLGDDLFVHTIANRYPNVKFYLWSSAINKTTFTQLKNLVVLDQYSSFIRFLKRLRPSFAVRYKRWKELKCDAVVYIGGSLFIEYDNWQQILTWWEYEALNRDFYVLGANFGPYHTEAYREKVAKIFADMKDVSLRDRYSVSLFPNVKTVRYAPDIVFSYPMKEGQTTEKCVFVSVIDCLSKDEDDNKLSAYESQYIEIIIRLLRELIDDGYRVVLASFCKAEGDENAVERIYSELPMGVTTVVNYNGTNIQEIEDAISQSSFIIASRFHATILGFVAGKPVLPVIYSDKTKNVLEDIGFSGRYLDIRHLTEISIDLIIKKIELQKLNNIEIIKKQAEDHFQKLDKLLN